MAKIKYDVSDVEPGVDFDTPVPVGAYLVKIEEVEETNSSKDDAPMLKITYVITKGEFKGRKIWDYIKYEAESQAWKLKNFIDALGAKGKGTLDTKKIVGTVLVMKTKIEKSEEYGESAKVGSLAPKPDSVSEEAEEEEEEETESEESEDGDEEELTVAGVREADDMDALRTIIEEYGVEGVRITKKSKVETVQDKIIAALELEEEAELPEDWDELTALDRDELEELIEASEDLEDIDPEEYEDDGELFEAVAEALEIEVPEAEEEDAPPDYNKMTVVELKAELVERGLRDKGSKKALVGRLKKADKEAAKENDGEPF